MSFKKLTYPNQKSVIQMLKYYKFIVCFSRSEAEVKRQKISNSAAQLPISTVVVRWNHFRSGFTYDERKVYSVMRTYGRIQCVIMGKGNNAYVVYDNLADACEPVFLKTIGPPKNKLFCHWYHRTLANKKFYGSNGRLKVRQYEN